MQAKQKRITLAGLQAYKKQAMDIQQVCVHQNIHPDKYLTLGPIEILRMVSQFKIGMEVFGNFLIMYRISNLQTARFSIRRIWSGRVERYAACGVLLEGYYYALHP